jgi:hypothetical protein
MIAFEEKDIDLIIINLDQLTVHGIKEAKALAVATQILEMNGKGISKSEQSQNVTDDKSEGNGGK